MLWIVTEYNIMKSVETKQYWTVEEYKEFEKVFTAFGEMILFAMAHFLLQQKILLSEISLLAH